MSKTTYVFQKQVYLSGMKESFSKGSKFDIVKTPKEFYAVVAGKRIEQTGDLEICIKAGFAIPYIQGKTEIKNEVKISKRAKDTMKKMEVQKSDADLMQNDIDITYTKNEYIKAKKQAERASKDLEVIHEDNTKTIRGMKVLYNNQGKSISENPTGQVDDVAKTINGDDAKVVANISKKSSKDASTKEKKQGRQAKKKNPQMSQDVKARLEQRKKQAYENHAKAVAEDEKAKQGVNA